MIQGTATEDIKTGQICYFDPRTGHILIAKQDEWPKRSKGGFCWRYPEDESSERPDSAKIMQPSIDIHSDCLVKQRVKEARRKLDKAIRKNFAKEDFDISLLGEPMIEFSKELGL